MEKLSWLSLLFLGCLLVVTLSHGVPAGADDMTDYHEDAQNGDVGDYNDENGDDEESEETETEPEVHAPAEIYSKAMSLDVDLRGEFQLPCQGLLSDDYSILWEKDGQTLFAGPLSQTNDERVSVEDGGKMLVVKNVTEKDAGRYRCFYSTPKPLEVVHTVHVRVGPRVRVDKAVRVLVHGEPATLDCIVSGYPEPSVYWERKNKKMPGGDQRLEGRLIEFPTVTRHHAGIYECFAENPIGSARTALDLQIRYPPEIEVEKESVSTGQGLDADLVCLVHAEPKATVVWYKNGQQVQIVMGEEVMEKVSHRYILHLKDVREDDFGSYQCMANNTLGRSNKSILLSGAPSQPVLEQSGVGDDGMSYSLVWSLESTIRVDQFRLKFRKTEEDWTEVDAEGSQTQPHVWTVRHVLENLSPMSNYQVSLTAQNDFGWSPESKVHNFHINGKEFQSLEAETGSGAKAVGSTGGASSVKIPALLSSPKSLIALFLCIVTAQLLQL